MGGDDVTLTNYIRNPRAGVNATDSATASNVTVTRILDAATDLDAATAYHVEGTGANSVEALFLTAQDFFTPATPLPSSLTITVSFDIHLTSGSLKLTHRWNFGAQQSWTAISPGATPTRLDFVRTIPSGTSINANSFQIGIFNAFPGQVTNAATYDLSLVQLEVGGVASPYLDGDMGTGYAWTGTAHNSASTYDPPVATIPIKVKQGGSVVDVTGYKAKVGGTLVDVTVGG